MGQENGHKKGSHNESNLKWHNLKKDFKNVINNPECIKHSERHLE